MKNHSGNPRSIPRAAYFGAGLALARHGAELKAGRRSVVLGNSAFLRVWAARRLKAASKTSPEGTPLA